MNEEFLFSFSREAMQKRCLREFYLHTIYSYGEYEVGSAAYDPNLVHLLKQLRSVKSFKEALLGETFRKIFIDGAPFADLKRILLNEFFNAKNDMLLGIYETDHLQSPILSQFYYDEVNIGDFFSDLADDLCSIADNLLNNDLVNSLFNAERQDFYSVSGVASVFLGRIKIHFPLIGVIKRAGVFYCLNFTDDENFFETSAVLDLLYCQQNLHVSPDCVRHVFIRQNGSICLKNDNSEFNISATLNNIAERSADLFFLTRELAAVDDPFSISSCKEMCNTCRFREFCNG